MANEVPGRRDLFAEMVQANSRSEQAQAAFDAGMGRLVDHVLAAGVDAVDLQRVAGLLNKLAVMGHLYPAVQRRLAQPDAQALLRRYLDDLAAQE